MSVLGADHTCYARIKFCRARAEAIVRQLLWCSTMVTDVTFKTLGWELTLEICAPHFGEPFVHLFPCETVVELGKVFPIPPLFMLCQRASII